MVIINEFSTISGEDFTEHELEFTAFEGAQSSSATEDPVWAPAVSHSFDYIAEEPSTIELSNGIRMPLLGLVDPACTTRYVKPIQHVQSDAYNRSGMCDPVRTVDPACTTGLAV
uniref:Uncharacterized protein n=1 Tax=Ascaris lumbricoides TaxID=6252 RepID=A0A0M3IMA9_ASCLU